jgi:hypothetical protein
MCRSSTGANAAPDRQIRIPEPEDGLRSFASQRRDAARLPQSRPLGRCRHTGRCCWRWMHRTRQRVPLRPGEGHRGGGGGQRHAAGAPGATARRREQRPGSTWRFWPWSRTTRAPPRCATWSARARAGNVQELSAGFAAPPVHHRQRRPRRQEHASAAAARDTDAAIAMLQPLTSGPRAMPPPAARSPSCTSSRRWAAGPGGRRPRSNVVCGWRRGIGRPRPSSMPRPMAPTPRQGSRRGRRHSDRTEGASSVQGALGPRFESIFRTSSSRQSRHRHPGGPSPPRLTDRSVDGRLLLPTVAGSGAGVAADSVRQVDAAVQVEVVVVACGRGCRTRRRRCCPMQASGHMATGAAPIALWAKP